MPNEMQDSNPNANQDVNPNADSGNPENPNASSRKRSARKKNKHDAPPRGRWKWGPGRKTVVIFARVPVEYAAHAKEEMQAYIDAYVRRLDALRAEKKE